MPSGRPSRALPITVPILANESISPAIPHPGVSEVTIRSPGRIGRLRASTLQSTLPERATG